MLLLRMQSFILLIIISSTLLLLQPVSCSSHESQMNRPSSSRSINSHTLEYRPNVSDITLHGLLLWCSMGFLMPVGLLLIRLCNKEESGWQARVLYYLHGILQVVSVLIATAGAVHSIQKFENSFDNNHQRIGLVLYAAVLVQALIGFCRPNRGRKGRIRWYFVHWLLGTVITVVGISNIYTGLESYHKRTKKDSTLWVVLFTAEVCILAFLYLLQDKWDYMMKMGRPSTPEEQPQIIIQSDQVVVHFSNNNKTTQKLLMEPCKKSNALINHFRQFSH